MVDPFSKRHGLQPSEPEITVRHEAPHEMRGVIVDIAYEHGMDPHLMRSMVCRILRVREDSSNWSAFPNVDNEVREHIDSCARYEVYDIIEATYKQVAQRMKGHSADADPSGFEREVNDYFRKRGIGWQLRLGVLELRGPESFEAALMEAKRVLAGSGRSVAERELHEAMQDLSRRPAPDLTGALQHGLAALECVARDVTGDSKATLGTILARHKNLVPRPLDQALEKLWGFASEKGRHLQEGQELEQNTVELAVQVAAATASYLVKATGVIVPATGATSGADADDLPF